MGQTKTAAKIIPVRNQALSSLLQSVPENTNFLSDYLKNIISAGPSSSRVQTAVTNYREQILPQIIGSLGQGKSSSALNQALSTGAQSLAQTLDADAMNALQLLQQLTQSSSSTALQASSKIGDPLSSAQIWLNSLLKLIANGLDAGFSTTSSFGFPGGI